MSETIPLRRVYFVSRGVGAFPYSNVFSSGGLTQWATMQHWALLITSSDGEHMGTLHELLVESGWDRPQHHVVFNVSVSDNMWAVVKKEAQTVFDDTTIKEIGHLLPLFPRLTCTH